MADDEDRMGMGRECAEALGQPRRVDGVERRFDLDRDRTVEERDHAGEGFPGALGRRAKDQFGAEPRVLHAFSYRQRVGSPGFCERTVEILHIDSGRLRLGVSEKGERQHFKERSNIVQRAIIAQYCRDFIGPNLY